MTAEGSCESSPLPDLHSLRVTTTIRQNRFHTDKRCEKNQNQTTFGATLRQQLIHIFLHYTDKSVSFDQTIGEYLQVQTRGSIHIAFKEDSLLKPAPIIGIQKLTNIMYRPMLQFHGS
jgi:hypothetical protein